MPIVALATTMKPYARIDRPRPARRIGLRRLEELFAQQADGDDDEDRSLNQAERHPEAGRVIARHAGEK
jgi:hypothetical protein